MQPRLVAQATADAPARYTTAFKPQEESRIPTGARAKLTPARRAAILEQERRNGGQQR